MRVLVVALLLLIATGSGVRTASPWEALAPAAGLYEGWAASGGALVPVETRLEAAPDGTLSGSYRFEQDGRAFHGTLGHGRATGPLELVFIWHDDWGWGVITLHFGAGFENFVAA